MSSETAVNTTRASVADSYEQRTRTTLLVLQTSEAMMDLETVRRGQAPHEVGWWTRPRTRLLTAPSRFHCPGYARAGRGRESGDADTRGRNSPGARPGGLFDVRHAGALGGVPNAAPILRRRY